MKKTPSVVKRAASNGKAHAPERSGPAKPTPRGSPAAVPRRAAPRAAEPSTASKRRPEASEAKPSKAKAGGKSLPQELAGLVERTKQELLELADSLGLTGVAKLAKAELAKRLLAARTEKAPGPTLRAAPPAAPPRLQPHGSAGPGAPPPEALSGAAAYKLDLGGHPAPAKPVDHIPWSYGQDRVTAMAIDPDRLYAYWEVTDQAIERARAALGAGGAAAWLDLRVYDASGLIFDGTNAHSYFDHGVSRSDRQWFFAVGKPALLGLRRDRAQVARGLLRQRSRRSARIDFPRRDPAPWVEPEWMTVLQVASRCRRGGARPPGCPAVPAVRAVRAAMPVPAAVRGPRASPRRASSRCRSASCWSRAPRASGCSASCWARPSSGSSGARRRARAGSRCRGGWSGRAAPVVSSWEAGPFSYPVTGRAPQPDRPG